MLAPARIPVAAGKNTANTVKKFSGEERPSEGLKRGPKLSFIVCPAEVRANKHQQSEMWTCYEDFFTLCACMCYYVL